MSKTVTEIIRRKRDGQANTPEEIQVLVSESVGGQIPRHQTGAWLMAAFLRGMNDGETLALTKAFVDSGAVVEFAASAFPVDKHSTGGVGDKTSLVVAPVVASAGLAVPMISGRGLGHTGGTLDKLESIPGFRTNLTLAEFRHAVERLGVAISGAADDLAPADRLFYSLRDWTATIESQPLIVASILSKKLAAGVAGLVIDVKTGCGAFMKNLAQARSLAGKLVSAGRRLGQRVVAVVSDMSQPLGTKVGNGLEVQEAVNVLQDRGPKDLRTLCLDLASRMIQLGRSDLDLAQAVEMASRELASGRALEKFRRMIEAQGGDPRVVDCPARLCEPVEVFEQFAEASGYVAQVRADLLGQGAMVLGAGRESADDSVDPSVGLELARKIGDHVVAGDLLAKVHYREEGHLRRALPYLRPAFKISETAPMAPALIQEVVV